MSSGKKHLKPLYWGIFSAGGTIAALALSSVIFIVCILIPFDLIGDREVFYDNITGFISNKFVFLVLAGIIFTILWHGVHRFYYIMHDLHIPAGAGTRYAFYLFAILAFVSTVIIGWSGA